MENPFEKIEQPFKPVPKELRSKVMKDIAFAKLLMGIASLFSVDLSQIITKTIANRDNQNK